MKTYKIRHNPAKPHEYNFDDLYDEISYHWEHKAQALQARRWRVLQRDAQLRANIA